MSDITRSEAIKTLKEHLSHWERLLQEHICEEQEGIDTISALKLAIASLETEEAYQLEYERTTKNDLGVDAISRKELLKIYEDRFLELQKLKHLKDNKGAEDRQMGVNYCINILKELPSVTPIRPKGHWIEQIDHEDNQYDSKEYREGCVRCKLAWLEREFDTYPSEDGKWEVEYE